MSALAGRTIVITGAGSGIGRAWTEGFLAAGACVVAADIDGPRLTDLGQKGALTLRADVAVTADVKALIAFALERSGRIDALFNNAGVAFRKRIEDLDDDEFEHHVAIHLFATIAGMRFAIPAMRRAGYGRIINTISRVAEAGTPLNSGYASAKAAIWAATRSAARETADADILINMLIPGPTNTPIWGRDMPNMQPPSATFPTARMLATLPAGGPSGKVFWNEREYHMFRQETASSHPRNSS